MDATLCRGHEPHLRERKLLSLADPGLSIVDLGVGHDQAGPIDRHRTRPANHTPGVRRSDPHDDGRVFGPPNGLRRARTPGNQLCHCGLRPVSAITSSTKSGGATLLRTLPGIRPDNRRPTPASFTCTQHAIKLYGVIKLNSTEARSGRQGA